MNEFPAGLRLYRTQLREAVARDLGRGKTRGRALRLAVPATAVTAAAAVAVVVFTGGSQVSAADAAILRGVATALTPHPGTILHEQALVTVAGQAPSRYELWEQADSPYAYRVIKFGHEASWNGSSYANYDPTSNTISEQPGGSSGSRNAPDDAAADLRALVESGQATIDSEASFDGVAAYKLTVNGASPLYLNGTAFVRRSDYRPLEIQTTSPAGPNGTLVPETIEYQTYEYLPAGRANLGLLDVASQHPGAQVVSQAVGATTTAK
jgi:hypothetical protein